jgi:hypothetical protein
MEAVERVAYNAISTSIGDIKSKVIVIWQKIKISDTW